MGQTGDSLGTGRGAGPSPLAPFGASQDQARWFLILCLSPHKMGQASHTRRTSLIVWLPSWHPVTRIMLCAGFSIGYVKFSFPYSINAERMLSQTRNILDWLLPAWRALHAVHTTCNSRLIFDLNLKHFRWIFTPENSALCSVCKSSWKQITSYFQYSRDSW